MSTQDDREEDQPSDQVAFESKLENSKFQPENDDRNAGYYDEDGQLIEHQADSCQWEDLDDFYAHMWETTLH